MKFFAGGRDRSRQSMPEGRVQWLRGLLILASMLGVVLIFFVVLSLLQFGSRETPEIRGAQPVATAAVSATAAARTTPTGTEAGSPTGITAVAHQSPYVRGGPGIDYGILTNLQDGMVVPVIGRTPDGSWLQIIAPSGVRGWTGASLLTVSGNISNVPVTQ